MKTKEQLQREIMGRVYMGYALRRVWSFTMLRLTVIMGSLVGILSFVSIRHVIANMPNPTNLGASYNFVTSALAHTELAVKLSLLAIITIGLFTIISLLKQRMSTQQGFARLS